MQFDFQRSHPVPSVDQSRDFPDYLLFLSTDGPIWVPRNRLRIELHPELEDHTDTLLLDVVGHGSATEAVLASWREEKLRWLFETYGIPYPGLSKSDLASTHV